VLIKPLVNRDEDHLIYIRQSAPGMGNENSIWSMSEIRDIQARLFRSLLQKGRSTERINCRLPLSRCASAIQIARP
jgi:hypothetical protein